MTKEAAVHDAQTAQRMMRNRTGGDVVKVGITGEQPKNGGEFQNGLTTLAM